VLDVVAALVALTVFSPVLTVAAALIRLDGGPALFRQARVGRHGVPFELVKLRTMRDGVVTGVGRWLRATGIDEIPQFVHVLRGEMAVVGPRPLTPDDLRRLGWADDAVRASVRPGITGPAQVLGGGPADALARDHALVAAPSVLGDLGWIAASFAVNVVGKARVRRWLTARRGTSVVPAPSPPASSTAPSAAPAAAARRPPPPGSTGARTRRAAGRRASAAR
jgi:lipopolysaccharide/colanic/teichoic acid biosynthesis glycosyltransferase